MAAKNSKHLRLNHLAIYHAPNYITIDEALISSCMADFKRLLMKR